MKILKKIFFVLLVIFAIIGIATVSVFFAIKFGWTNTKGIIDKDSRFLKASVDSTQNLENEEAADETPAFIPSWTNSSEWKTLSHAAVVDSKSINEAAEITGVPARLIVAQLVVEQLRLYNSEREIFKQIFQPLQILGVQSQFSWGVMGIKQETAVAVEKNLKAATSTWYLGKNFEKILDFETVDQGKERFERLTDEHNHYYSYLYTALYLKQIMKQWNAAGFDISNRPEILSTLYNIGFSHSKPNANPKSGGAEINVSGSAYSFGDLAAQFYYSNELISEFPRN